MILAIETATAVCAAAAVGEGTVRAERSHAGSHIHSRKLLPMIREVLASAGLGVSELDAIAVSIGPGSFTGLRIGLSTAKGLAYAADIPVVPVPTLEGLAMNLAGSTDGHVLTVLPSRRGEIYAASYLLTTGTAELRWGPVSSSIGDLFSIISRSESFTVTGDGTDLVMAALILQPETVVHRFRAAPANLLQCRALSVGIVGERLVREARFADLPSLEPLYLKEFFTTMTTE